MSREKFVGANAKSGVVSSTIFVPDGQQVLSNVLAGLEQNV